MKTFNFKLIKMLDFSRTLYSILLRDFDEFSKFDITEEKITSFAEKVKFVDDKLLEIGLTRMSNRGTFNKKQAKDKIFQNLRLILLKLDLKFRTSDKVFFKGIYINNISTLKDIQLYENIKNLISFGRQHSDKLQSAGITTDDINELETHVNTFWDCIEKKSIETKLNKEYTAELKQISMELYEQLSDFCKIGKFIWETNGSYAKYNDYLLYKNININKRKKTKNHLQEKNKEESESL